MYRHREEKLNEIHVLNGILYYYTMHRQKEDGCEYEKRKRFRREIMQDIHICTYLCTYF